MGRISSSIGLITGTDIVGTVDRLLAISAQPRDRLVARTERLQEQQSAIAELTALVIGVELSSKRLSLPGQFEARSATSGNDKAVSVTAASNAEMGSFTARTLQLAATHSAESDFRSTGSATSLGLSGEILIRGGGFLAESADLAKLNQGRGVQAGSIRISDRAGNSAEIDLSKAQNIDDVINAINETSSIQVRATTVGDSIRLTDISGSTASNLRVDEVGSGETAADLGLRGINVASNTALGHDIYGAIGDTVATGLQGIKLSELNGGTGLGTLGTIRVRTSNGNTGSIDLSSATTTQDVLRIINDSGLGVEARLNVNSGGFRIRDLTGGNANPMSITSTDSTASKLGIDGTSTGRVIDGKDLGRPIIKNDTKLAELRQGRGISPGTIRISDSTGKSANVALEDTQQLTIDQLLTGINNAGLSLTASINATGDGIQIIDTGNGSQKLQISDVDEGQTASDLGLTGASRTTSLGSLGRLQTLSSAARQSVTVAATDSLTDIARKVNSQSTLATAAVVQAADGTFSLSIRSNRGGDAGRLSISSTGTGLRMSTNVTGQDAIMSVTNGSGTSIQLRSTDGVFTDVVPGVSLTAKEVTDDPISITVERDTKEATTNIKAFVEQYNKLNDRLDELTFFNGDRSATGLLFGTSEALRIESSYSRLMSGQIQGAGSIRSFGELGISLDTEGKMQLDEKRFTDRLSSNSDAAKTFFTSERTGMVARIKEASDRLAGVNSSLLINRGAALTNRILRNNEQADNLQRRLDSERLRLLRQFISAEEAIAKLQTNQSAISRIQFIGNQSNTR